MKSLVSYVKFYIIFSTFCIICAKLGCVQCYTNNQYVSLNIIANKHSAKSISQGHNLILYGNNLRLIFENSARTFSANGILMPLGFPCAIINKQLSIADADYKTHVLPFFTRDKTSHNSPLIIVLDPGHGGHDNGTVSANGLQEKAITLDICKKIAQILSTQKYKVYLTRTSDIFLKLNDRAELSNKKNATIFVSIHCNSAESKSARGVETFILTPYGQPSQNKAKKTLSDLKQYPNNRFDSENLMLAYNIQKSVIEKTRNIDRGVKHNRFHVFKNLKCPGVLVECGFLSNQFDRQNLASDKYRQFLAEAIVDGIIKFAH